MGSSKLKPENPLETLLGAEQVMHASSSSSPPGGGLPRQRAVQNAASAAAAVAESAWDADNVVYVGMEYSNSGACSQRGPTALKLQNNTGGCSQKKTATFDLTTSGVVGELVRNPGHHVEPSCPRQAGPNNLFSRCGIPNANCCNLRP